MFHAPEILKGIRDIRVWAHSGRSNEKRKTENSWERKRIRRSMASWIELWTVYVWPNGVLWIRCDFQIFPRRATVHRTCQWANIAYLLLQMHQFRSFSFRLPLAISCSAIILFMISVAVPYFTLVECLLTHLPSNDFFCRFRCFIHCECCVINRVERQNDYVRAMTRVMLSRKT